MEVLIGGFERLHVHEEPVPKRPKIEGPHEKIKTHVEKFPFTPTHNICCAAFGTPTTSQEKEALGFLESSNELFRKFTDSSGTTRWFPARFAQNDRASQNVNLACSEISRYVTGEEIKKDEEGYRSARDAVYRVAGGAEIAMSDMTDYFTVLGILIGGTGTWVCPVQSGTGLFLPGVRPWTPGTSLDTRMFKVDEVNMYSFATAIERACTELTEKLKRLPSVAEVVERAQLGGVKHATPFTRGVLAGKGAVGEVTPWRVSLAVEEMPYKTPDTIAAKTKLQNLSARLGALVPRPYASFALGGGGSKVPLRELGLLIPSHYTMIFDDLDNGVKRIRDGLQKCKSPSTMLEICVASEVAARNSDDLDVVSGILFGGMGMWSKHDSENNTWSTFVQGESKPAHYVLMDLKSPLEMNDAGRQISARVVRAAMSERAHDNEYEYNYNVAETVFLYENEGTGENYRKVVEGMIASIKEYQIQNTARLAEQAKSTVLSMLYAFPYTTPRDLFIELVSRDLDLCMGLWNEKRVKVIIQELSDANEVESYGRDDNLVWYPAKFKDLTHDNYSSLLNFAFTESMTTLEIAKSCHARISQTAHTEAFLCGVLAGGCGYWRPPEHSVEDFRNSSWCTPYTSSKNRDRARDRLTGRGTSTVAGPVKTSGWTTTMNMETRWCPETNDEKHWRNDYFKRPVEWTVLTPENVSAQTCGVRIENWNSVANYYVAIKRELFGEGTRVDVATSKFIDGVVCGRLHIHLIPDGEKDNSRERPDFVSWIDKGTTPHEHDYTTLVARIKCALTEKATLTCVVAALAGASSLSSAFVYGCLVGLIGSGARFSNSTYPWETRWRLSNKNFIPFTDTKDVWKTDKSTGKDSWTDIKPHVLLRRVMDKLPQAGTTEEELMSMIKIDDSGATARRVVAGILLSGSLTWCTEYQDRWYKRKGVLRNENEDQEMSNPEDKFDAAIAEYMRSVAIFEAAAAGELSFEPGPNKSTAEHMRRNYKILFPETVPDTEIEDVFSCLKSNENTPIHKDEKNMAVLGVPKNTEQISDVSVKGIRVSERVARVVEFLRASTKDVTMTDILEQLYGRTTPGLEEVHALAFAIQISGMVSSFPAPGKRSWTWPKGVDDPNRSAKTLWNVACTSKATGTFEQLATPRERFIKDAVMFGPREIGDALLFSHENTVDYPSYPPTNKESSNTTEYNEGLTYIACDGLPNTTPLTLTKTTLYRQPPRQKKVETCATGLKNEEHFVEMVRGSKKRIVASTLRIAYKLDSDFESGVLCAFQWNAVVVDKMTNTLCVFEPRGLGFEGESETYPPSYGTRQQNRDAAQAIAKSLNFEVTVLSSQDVAAKQRVGPQTFEETAFPTSERKSHEAKNFPAFWCLMFMRQCARAAESQSGLVDFAEIASRMSYGSPYEAYQCVRDFARSCEKFGVERKVIKK